MFDSFKRSFSVISAIALASSFCCIACEDDNDETKDSGKFETRKVSETETIQCAPVITKDYSKTDEKSIIDYLVSVCTLSNYFQKDDYKNSEQKIGSPCFCYGPDCELAGYERPEQGTIIGCKNVQPVAKAVPICLRSSNLDIVKPAIYFPNGMCAVAISKCTTINDKSNYICGFAKFGSLYTPDASGRLVGDENADAEIANFKAADCPDGSVMAEFEMNISVGIDADNPKTAKLEVVGCFPGCNTDSDCRSGEYDYILQDKGKLHCMTANPNADGEKAKVCFDERTVEFSSIGIRTVKAYGFKAE